MAEPTTKPKRIQLRRTKDWRKPERAIVVSRPSKWGNPERSVWGYSAAERLDCYRWFERHLRERRDPESAAAFIDKHVRYPSDDEIRAELAGHDLACWCPLDQPCHADVLLELANGDHR